MENISESSYRKDEASYDSGPKPFKLFGQLIKPHEPEKHEVGNSMRTNESGEVHEAYFLGKKVLTKSDTDASSRLLLGRDMVLSGIIPFLHQSVARRCETVDGLKINVHDLDTNTNHELVLKMWKSNSFVLTGNWNRDFVKRRILKKNDEIELYWDQQNSRLNFTILRKFEE